MTYGEFVGHVDARWLDDNRYMRLLADFEYVDRHGERWHVPAGWQINGASIPRRLWHLIGSPFVGSYRKASVIHDVYCDLRVEDSSPTHRMFFEACRAGGTSPLRATIMWLAVRIFGPQFRKGDPAANHRLGWYVGLSAITAVALLVYFVW